MSGVIKESRMKFANVTKFDRKSGRTLRRTWGTRPVPTGFGSGTDSAEMQLRIGIFTRDTLAPFRVVLHQKSAHRETTSERDVMRAVYIQPFEATAGPVFNQ